MIEHVFPSSQGEPAPRLVPTFLSEASSLVAILIPKNVRFEPRDPGLVYAMEICNILK